MYRASPADFAGGGSVCCFIPFKSSAMVQCVENPQISALSPSRMKSSVNTIPVLEPFSKKSSEELCQIAGNKITERFMEGWKLLHCPCPVCGIPAMTKDGVDICVLCGPVFPLGTPKNLEKKLDFDGEVESSEKLSMNCVVKDTTTTIKNSSRETEGDANASAVEEARGAEVVANEDMKMKDAAINTELVGEAMIVGITRDTVDQSEEIKVTKDVSVEDKASSLENLPVKEEGIGDDNFIKGNLSSDPSEGKVSGPGHDPQTKGAINVIVLKKNAAINATDLSGNVEHECIVKNENGAKLPQNIVSLSVVISSDSSEEENLDGNDDGKDDSLSKQCLDIKPKEVEEHVHSADNTERDEMVLFIACRNRIVPKLNELMLSGWIILSETCADCGLSLLMSKSGEQACAACGPVQTAKADQILMDADDAFHLEVGKRVLAGWNVFAGSSCSLCDRPLMRSSKGDEECINCGKKVKISLELPATFELTSRKSVDELLSTVKEKLEQHNVHHSFSVDQMNSEEVPSAVVEINSAVKKVEAPRPVQTVHTPGVAESEQKVTRNLLVNTTPEWTLSSAEFGVEVESSSHDDAIARESVLLSKHSAEKSPVPKCARQCSDSKNVAVNVSSSFKPEHGGVGAVRSSIMTHSQRQESPKYYSKDMFKGWFTLAKNYCKCGGPIMSPPHCREVFCVNFVCPRSFYQTRRKVGNVDDYLRRTASEDNSGHGNISTPNQQTMILKPRENIRSFLVTDPSVSTKNTVEVVDLKDVRRPQTFASIMFPNDEKFEAKSSKYVESSDASAHGSRASKAAAASVLEAIFMLLNRIEKEKAKIMPTKIAKEETSVDNDSGTALLIEKLAAIAVTKM